MDDPNEVLRQATGADDPQEVLNQAMGIRYKGQYDGNIFNRGLEAAQDFGSNAVDELSGWKNKVANDISAISAIKPVQMENRSNEDIQADTDTQNQQLGQLYGDAIANPAGKVAITPFVPGQIRAAAGLLYAPELLKDVGENYQANLDDPAEVLQAATGDGSNLRRYANAVGKTAYQTLVDPIVQPAKNLISNPAQFGQNIVNDPSKLWSDILLPGAIGKGGYDVSKKAINGVKAVKAQYGDAMNTLDDMSQSIPRAPEIADNPMDILEQARGGIAEPTPVLDAPLDRTYYNVLDEVSDTGLTDLTSNKLNLLARDFESQFGEPLNVTSMKRNGDGSSWHDSGQAVDLAGGILETSPEARQWLMQQGEKYGLTGLDEYANPSANATGGHIHFSDHGEAIEGVSAQPRGYEPRPNTEAMPSDEQFAQALADDGPLTGLQEKSINQDDIPTGKSDLISQAHDAAEQGDYQSAYQLAYRAGDSDWAETYKHMRDRPISQDEQIKADIEKSLNGESIDPSNPVSKDFSAAELLNGKDSSPTETDNLRMVDGEQYTKDNGALTAPQGYAWFSNGESRFANNSRKSILLPDKLDAALSDEKLRQDVHQYMDQNSTDSIKPPSTEFSRVPTQNEFTSEIDNMVEQSKQPEQMRGVNEEMLNKAQDAAMNGDYATAAEYARQAGADDWAKSFQLVVDTDGGTKPIAPRLDPKATSEYTGDTITKRQIMKRAAELFVPVRTGRIGKADVMGFADHNAGIIRTRDYGDLNTMAHEIGHITDAALGLRGEAGAFDREFSRVVDNRFGKDAYEPEQKRAEGIAEFMKDYLTDENTAKAEMPAYYSKFKAALEKNPDIKGRVNEIKSMFDTWQRQSPEARGRAAVSYADEMKPNVKERTKQAKLKFVEDWVDDKVGLKRVSESYERATGERLATKDDPYKMARLAQNSSVARAQMLVEGDKPELVKAALNKVYGNIIDEGVTIKGVLKELDASLGLKDRQDYLKAGNFKNWHEALDSLLVARRQAELQQLYPGYKGPMSPSDAKTIIARAPQALNDAAKKIYTYNDNILRILEENGMIKTEVYDALTKKYQSYVPMARDFADESGLEKGFGMGGQGFGNVRAALKSISEEGSTRQVVSPLESIVKNTYAMLNLVERNRVGQTFIKMADGDRVGKLVEEVTGTANTKDSTFSVWQNGEKKLYQTEPEIYRAIMSVNKDTANIITKLLSPPAQLLRAGATLTPDFAVKNIVRDSFGAAVFSRYGFRPIIDHAAGLFHMAKQDALFHEYKASGALMSTMVGLDRDYIQGSLKGLYKKDLAHYWNHYNPVQVLRGFSEMLETATRLGEYNRAVKKGVSVEDAALSARDISLDFSQHGVYGKTANKVIAFFNAGVQEPVRIIQAFKENPVGTSAKVAMYITLPSIALWAMNHDQQWYKELPAYQKNLFWCFKAGDTVYRIPKPFGLGVLFGSMPERMLDYMETRRPQEMKEWASSAAGAFLPNFMPTAVGPMIEWATNYSFFQGRSIVPQKEQKLPDEMQYGPNTSELAKEIGSIFGVSPRKIDNTISGYGAGMANQALNAMDAFSGSREYQNPFQKAFTVDPMKSPQSVQDFYDKLDEVQKEYNGAKATKTKLDSDALHNYNLLNYANQNMEYINKMERLATQKGDDTRVADLKKKQLDIAQKAMAKVR